MATTTVPYAHTRTRQATVLGRLLTATAAALPQVGRWLSATAHRARRAALHVGGLGAIVAAAWQVAVPLGLLTAGVSLLLLEYLTADSEPHR